MSRDISGRLAAAVEELRDAHVRYDHHYDGEAPLEHRMMMRRANQALIDYRANPSGWIPVSERLPDEMKVVWTAKGKDVIEAHRDGGVWRDSQGYRLTERTHWMPRSVPSPTLRRGRKP